MVAAGRVHEQHVRLDLERGPPPRGEGPPSTPGGQTRRERRPRRKRQRLRRGGRAGGAPSRPTPDRPSRPGLTFPGRSKRSSRRPRATRPPVARSTALHAPASPAPEGTPRPSRATAHVRIPARRDLPRTRTSPTPRACGTRACPRRCAACPTSAPPPGVLLGKRGGRQLHCHFVTRAHCLPLYGKHRLAP
jgi:hypothetical protein